MINTTYFKVLIIQIAIIFMYCGTSSAQTGKQTSISGYIKTGNKPDTVILQVFKEFGTGNMGYASDTTLTCIAENGRFHFDLGHRSQPFYIQLYLSNAGNFYINDWRRHEFFQYMVMPGDQISATFDEVGQKIIFSGKGSAKFKWYNASARAAGENKPLPMKVIKINGDAYFKKAEATYRLKYKMLQNIKNELGTTEYKLLATDLRSRIWGGVLGTMAQLNFMYSFDDQAYADTYFKAYQQYAYHKTFIDESPILRYSLLYADFLRWQALAKLAFLKKLDPGKKYPDEYNWIKAQYPKGIIRDKLLTAYVFGENAKYGFQKDAFEKALEDVKTPAYRNVLQSIISTKQKGSLVDNQFQFTDMDGKKISLVDFKGKVVLIDFWFTGCKGCIDVVEGLKTVEKSFTDKDVVFLSLSIDKDRAQWLQSIGEGKTYFTSHHTKYVYTSGTGTVNSFIKKYNPSNTYPQLMLLDRQGKVYITEPVKPFGPESEEKLIKQIEEALNHQ